MRGHGFCAPGIEDCDLRGRTGVFFRAKTASRRVQTRQDASRRANAAPRGCQDAPKTAREASKTLQDAPQRRFWWFFEAKMRSSWH